MSCNSHLNLSLNTAVRTDQVVKSVKDQVTIVHRYVVLFSLEPDE